MQVMLITLINLLYYTLLVLVLARVVMSFTNISPYHPISQFIYQATEPIMAPVRRLLPAMGGFDFSPIVVLIAAQLLRGILVSIIVSM
jgi:YggT family protein